MEKRYSLLGLLAARCRAAGLLLALAALPAAAQHSCLLVPVPLAERVAAAALIVEAGVTTQQVVNEGGHLHTLSELTVYKTFAGAAPSVLRLAEAGGTLGLRREVVSSGVTLAPGQQGLFLLEPHPTLPNAYRLVAGPQGFVGYDLAARTAVEPFGRYASIAGQLYPAVEALVGQPLRAVRPNAALAGALPVARPLAVPAIDGFSPARLAAGTNAVLTINGANFGAARGSGSVEFPNANNGGGSFVAANPADYLAWSDTQIRVRVPSTNVATGGVAGTGLFRVMNAGGETSSGPTALKVVYALSNLGQGPNEPPIRPRLISDDGQGGYTLRYSPSFTATAGAVASFERALATWACGTRLRRVVDATTAAPEATGSDGTNAVRFGTLSAGVLGVTNSYYSGCQDNGVTEFSLVETDYTFVDTPTSGTTWHFGTADPTTAQYDFESVALHEQGHGAQLTHIIDAAAVMHFSISNGQARRTLSTASDVAGVADVLAYSSPATCGFAAPVATAVPAGCSQPLPVELTHFTARYAAGGGTTLAWATASERNSAYFAVEARDEGGPATWAEVLRQPAAGTSTAPRTYAAHDPRLLAGTRYYRLRQADADGRTSYSPPVAVAGLEAGLALYPNPVADRLQVSGPARAGQLLLRDLAGRPVARFALPPGPQTVDVAGLRPGLYLVEWTDGATVRRGQLQKQ